MIIVKQKREYTTNPFWRNSCSGYWAGLFFPEGKAHVYRNEPGHERDGQQQFHAVPRKKHTQEQAEGGGVIHHA